MTHETEQTQPADEGRLEPPVRPLVDALRALPDTRPEPEPFEAWRDACGLALAAADELDRLRRALHEIGEEWAGAECGEPVHAQEAYAIGLAKRMYSLAADALRPNVGIEPHLPAQE